MGSLSHPHATMGMAHEGDLKPPGWSPANRPLARSVVPGEEPPARPSGRGGKERARENPMETTDWTPQSIITLIVGMLVTVTLAVATAYAFIKGGQ